MTHDSCLYHMKAVAEFENGFAHANAQGFGLAAARDGAAVVAAEDNGGGGGEVGAKESLAANKKVV